MKTRLFTLTALGVIAALATVTPTVTLSAQETNVSVAQLAPAKQLDAVRALIGRRFPAVKDKITLELTATENGKQVFEVINGANGGITIRGSNGIAAAQGLNWYMKHVCNQMLSWCGSHVDITPETMKKVPNNTFRQVLPHQKNVYMNYCTLGYSAPFWSWERWEWEIDFMALNGINMPLAMTGIEAAWYNALTRPEIGFTDLEARQFLVGPAHMPWQWMQNIENGGDPLPKSWIDTHAKLGKQIIDREREFGMTPIQQGFSGHVPKLFKTKFPDAKIRFQGKWCNWPGVAQLDPTDPLFAKFGKIFIEEEGKLFGFGGFYAADPFHESAPPGDIKREDIPKYLADVGKNIYDLFKSVDPNAIWVMQAWDIRKDIACAVPLKKLLVLDLNGGKWKSTKSFWGHEFCTGQLHNFGGRINMHGDIRSINTNPFVAAQKVYPDSALGSGLFMEGIIQNPVFYESVFDMWWRSDATPTDQWMKDYAARRYGLSNEKTTQAWELLLDAPYRRGTNGTENSSIIAARPSVKAKKSGPNAGFGLHKAENYIIARDLLLDVRENCKKSDGYRFDIADLSRQVMSNLAFWVHLEMQANYDAKDVKAFKENAKIFHDLLMDADRICETRSEYRFSDWINDATSWGKTTEEKNYLDKNATMLVTYWGPEKSPIIHDYGWREWGGLIRSYYVPRWDMFHAYIIDKLEKGEAYQSENLPSAHGREAWRANDIYNKMADWEENFVSTPKKMPRVTSHEDEITVALELQKKWDSLARKAYGKAYQK